MLADSGHAWRYGTSVRVSAGRDVFLEETKDSAIAIYSRDVAVRVVERIGALGDLSTRGTADVQRLGERYGLTHVVTAGRLRSAARSSRTAASASTRCRRRCGSPAPFPTAEAGDKLP